MPALAQAPVSPAAVSGLPLKFERSLSEKPLSDGPTPTYGRGDAISGRPDREVTLQGNAEMRRGSFSVRADRLTYYQVDDEVVGVGNVRVVKDGNTFTGPQLRLRIDANTGSFENPRFTLPLYNGRGQAESVEFLGPERVRFGQGVYTTCQATDPDWYLKTRTLTVDEASQSGNGRDADLYFKGARVFTAPAFSFSLGDQRKSGFLAPTFILNSRTGVEVLTPYYFNIAPNRDFTLYPRLSARRGLQIGGALRYLEPNFFGESRFEYNPSDPVADSSRYFWSSLNTFTNVFGWAGGTVLRGVSDDNYFVDYSRSILASSERSLPRDVFASRAFGDWVVTMRALRYQNILDARGAPPYERLPQVAATYTARDIKGFDFVLPLDGTYFSRPLIASPEGLRLVANPQLSYPIIYPGWFITPKVGLHLSSYHLDQNALGVSETITRSVPTFSLDMGMVFERNASYGKRDFLQTLEPRVFYSRTPFRNQSAIPVFDTGVADFNFAQLFSENTFIGNDRIADVNQLTTALVSRLITPNSGAEAFRFAVGQRSYFSDQLVTIPNQVARTDRRSDLLFAAGANLGNGMSMDAALQYGLDSGQLPRLNLLWRYLPADGRIFNAGLRYLRNELGQADVSWRAPIAPRWQTLGRVNYSFLDQRIDATTGNLVPAQRGVVEGLLGVEYTDDCWKTRVVVQRFVTAAGTTTSQFFFQLELSGLARIGSNPFDILRRNIPGYQLPTDKPVAPSRYFGYD
jgi:LPS-assembly protein